MRRAQLEKNRYKDEFWLYRAGRLRRLRLPAGVRKHWWWDENTLLLAMPAAQRQAKPPQKAMPATTLETRPLAGGKGRELLRTHMPVEEAWPLPGGRLLVLAQWGGPVQAALAAAKGDAKKAAALLEKERGCTVLEDLPFWENGTGYVQGRRRLFVWEGGPLRPLTGEALEVEQSVPAPGGGSVWVLAKEYGPAGTAPVLNRLLEVDVASGKINDHTFLPLRHDAMLPLPGGGALVLGSNMRTHGLNQNPAFYRLSADGGVTLLDDSGHFGFDSSLLSDINLAAWNGRLLPLPGGAAFLATLANGSHIMALHGSGGRPLPVPGAAAHSHGAPPAAESGAVTQITKKPGAVGDIAPAPDGFYAVALRDAAGPEVYHIAQDGRETRLTHLNDDAVAGTRIAPLLPLTAQNEGRDIHGWVMLPPGTEAGGAVIEGAESPGAGRGDTGSGCESGSRASKTAKESCVQTCSKEISAAALPAILYVHGGPQAAYGPVLFHEMQYWAAQGYAVLLCNPSGSAGRGDDFADIRGDYGGRDSRDLLAFLDAALAQHPAIDPARLGVAGGSYGGFMVNWLVGHSGRFAAAVSQRGIASWETMRYLSDIGGSFVPDQIGGQLPGLAGGEMGPKDDGRPLSQLLRRQSPLAFAGKAATPTLFLHSDEDYRCPLPEGLQMYAALKLQGVPCRMVVFHGENHELSRSGRPQNRLRRLREMRDWFDKYLKSEGAV